MINVPRKSIRKLLLFIDNLGTRYNEATAAVAAATTAALGPPAAAPSLFATNVRPFGAPPTDKPPPQPQRSRRTRGFYY
ncbi:hypothetical protein GWI33_009267 [Rhynchophorus ferrugineus]|uniref:Uncharacterized protein n=1 Tax=Rhynchophorus ferrugineus TaxID=354439 RepID=A0A834IGT8_RHYFE|nr:hypothetical protein GWI33_009267 [Rhynchophorus ferrugineus]